MPKLKTVLKSFLISVPLSLLSFNAGYDGVRYVKKHQAEALVAKRLLSHEAIAAVNVRNCFNISDFGWVCDVEATSIDGRHMRSLLTLPYEALEE